MLVILPFLAADGSFVRCNFNPDAKCRPKKCVPRGTPKAVNCLTVISAVVCKSAGMLM